MSIEPFAIVPPGDWTERAACRGMDPGLFYAERGQDVRAAKAVCRECPVRQECLDYALANVERHGVWGGLSERERLRIRRQRRNEAGVRVTGPAIVRPDRTREICGSWSGINMHRRLDEVVCRACKDHERSRRGHGVERSAAQCGTDSGYQRHIIIGTPPCDACRAARREAKRAYRARQRAVAS